MKLLVAFALLVSLLCVSGQSNNYCQGTVSASGATLAYNLAPLYTAIGGVVQTTSDSGGNTYYYLPCSAIYPSVPQCGFLYSQYSSICQKDGRTPPTYHGLGDVNSTVWSPRLNGDPATGFILSFPTGGDPSVPPNRTSDIEFICNPAAGVGTFKTNMPAENPIHDYHLVWETQYACPINASSGNCTLTVLDMVQNAKYSCIGQSNSPDMCNDTTHGTNLVVSMNFVCTSLNGGCDSNSPVTLFWSFEFDSNPFETVRFASALPPAGNGQWGGYFEYINPMTNWFAQYGLSVQCS